MMKQVLVNNSCKTIHRKMRKIQNQNTKILILIIHNVFFFLLMGILMYIKLEKIVSHPTFDQV